MGERELVRRGPKGLGYEVPKSTAALLHDELRRAIIEGRFKAGQSLSESDVCRHYDVSRQPVREAFAKLAYENLIEVLPQRGTYVRRISARQVMQARFVREVIEVAVVQELASHAGRADIVVRLRGILREQASVADDDRAAFNALDEAFHQALANGCDRDFAWQVVEDVKAQMDRVRYLSLERETPFNLLVDQHSRIVDAIELGDPAAAGEAVRAHLREIWRTLPEIAKQHPEAFEPDEAAPQG
ncbi:GntR family transcriptional regulator [Uliginosibacterium sp. sgz301328]|uniref:GntR family transcriptional regulator n=1 Tax=Uliginosibacterium sp. sgz301328 TaxID=3243764 RepID=UPI00359EC393